MKVVNDTILTATLNSSGAVTEYGSATNTPVLVSLAGYPGPVEYNLVLKVVGNATAPGTSKTVTVHLYFSDVRLSAAGDALTSLAGRKTSATAITLANSANLTAYHDVVFSFGTIKPKAKYIYVSLSGLQLDSGASVVATLALVRQPAGRDNIK